MAIRFKNKVKRFSGGILAVVMLLLLTFQIYAENSGEASYDRIFVVDVSASMKKDNLDQKVKKAIIDYIKKCKAGDRIIIIAFGSSVNSGMEDVVLRESTISQDMEQLASLINSLKFEDEWTWMTKAFDVIGNRLKDLQMAYPDRPKRIYIFTDGFNEPPPGQKELITFQDVLKHHKMDFDKKDTFIYLIQFNGDDKDTRAKDKEFDDFIKSQGNLIIVEKPRETPILYQEISINPSVFSVNLPLKDDIQFPVEFETTRLENAANEKIEIALNKSSLPANAVFDFNPKLFLIENVGQKCKIELKIGNLEKKGIYEFEFKLMPQNKEIVINPNKILVKTSFSQEVISVLASSGSLKIKEGEEKTTLSLEFENKTSSDSVSAKVLFSDASNLGNLKIEPSQINLQKGKNKIDFSVHCKNLKKGKYPLEIEIKPLNDSLKFNPEKLKVELKVVRPFPYKLAILIAVLGLLVVLVFGFLIFAYSRIEKAYEKWTLTINGDSISLKALKKPFALNITIGKDILQNIDEEKLFDVSANLKTVFSGDLFITPYMDIKDFKSGEKKILDDIEFSKNNVHLSLKKNF